MKSTYTVAGAMDAKLLWREVLGADADPARSFVENGGDSYLAVLVTVRAFEIWQVEIDYLDVLQAPDAAGLEKLAGRISPEA
jgi:hypothetical protein